MPATSGTAARIGPKNRPTNIVAMPQRANHSEACLSDVALRESGQVTASFGPSQTANSNAAQSPKNAPAAAALYAGRKLSPATPIIAPTPTKMTVAGTMRDRKAKDSMKDRRNTTGPIQPS